MKGAHLPALLSPFSEELMNEVLRPLEEEGYLIYNMNLDRSEGVALNGREISMLRISYQRQRLAYQLYGKSPTAEPIDKLSSLKPEPSKLNRL